ncbi:MAG: 23S rRNA (guanosine(2251)-2'-O)-methyltransferase RlmB [Bacteroidia bacterium]
MYKTPPRKPQTDFNLLYGVHPIEEAIQAGAQLEKIWIQKDKQAETIHKLKELAEAAKIPCQVVPAEKIQSLCPTGNHQGVIAAMAAVAYYDVATVLKKVMDKGEMPLFIILDGITDVRNFGAIARSAECMGAHAIIVPTQGSAPINADAIKTSAGALSYLPVCREHHLTDVAHIFQSEGIQLVACTEKASKPFYDISFAEPTCLVFGSEEKGISSSLLKACKQKTTIPMKGKIGSLNVAVSVGMVLSEIVRQRSLL